MPGTHSFGKTERSTKDAAEGLAAKRRDSRIETKDRARRRETMEVFVLKMERAIRSARDGRDGDQRRDVRSVLTRRSR